MKLGWVHGTAIFLFLLTVGCHKATVLRIGPEELPEATVGEPYQVKFQVPDANSELVKFIVQSGSIPPGIKGANATSEDERHQHFSPECFEGEWETVCIASAPSWIDGLYGVPAEAGTYEFTVVASLGSARGSRTYQLIVRP